MTRDELNARRRKERWMLFSPGEWLWVTGFFAAWSVGLTLWFFG